MTVQDIDRETFTADWTRWHRQHEAKLADPHGFLAITGLHWLSAEPQRFADAPGAWSADDATSGITTYQACRSLSAAAPARAAR